MIIGIPRERKAQEGRIALLPEGVQQLVSDGHRVVVEADAGDKIGIAAEAWQRAGAELVPREQLWQEAELVVKVKEPQPEEWPLLRRGQIVFGYFHFAADAGLVTACREAGIAALAFETRHDAQGRLPLLRPMSEIAGRLSAQFAARCLEAPYGGPGLLMGSIGGCAAARTVVIGGGVAGVQAARVAAGMGSEVVVFERDGNRLRELETLLPSGVAIRQSNPQALAEACRRAQVIIACALVPGAKAPHLIDRQLISELAPGCVLVDIAIDQGGCAATSRPTTHAEPTFVVDEVIHCCVANMPGAVPRSASQALSNAVFEDVRRLAAQGLDAYLDTSPGHRAALNMHLGEVLLPGLE